MLSLTGGMAGILVMLMVSLLVALTFPAFPLQPQLFFIASALLLAALIGLLAGAVPAWRAASLNPVDALRAE